MTQAGGSVTKTKKTILGGRVYVVHKAEDNPKCWIVGKMGPAGSGVEEEYRVDENGACECKAADFGNVCKHVKMVKKKLEGPEISRRKAENMLEEFLEKVRGQFPGSRVVGLVKYNENRTVTKAAALGCGLLSSRNADRIDIWGEQDDLVVLLQIFREEARFRKALSVIRYKASGNTIPKADKNGYIEGIGQTYGKD